MIRDNSGMRVNDRRTLILVWVLGVCLSASLVSHTGAQTPRHIKVVLHSQQTESLNRDGVQGSGSVVIRRGTVSPS
ncbi:MAG TPA: hypothetical protein VLM90_10260, partial [Candidatus Deferrimicrobium sp.]|nr:hypothetical protein [Candidatus Deferrimicrobium sp.]